MIIGVPKEVKVEEYRVAITPESVSILKQAGHTILIEAGAGEGSGFLDFEYEKAGASILNKRELFQRADLILKVKEPLPYEYEFFKEKQAIFTFLHLAPNPELTKFLIKKKITALAYETLEQEGKLPILYPMSQIAGRMAPIIGAYYLQKVYGGLGILPTGTETTRPAKILILGCGVVGSNALKVAAGLGMDITVIDRNYSKLEALKEKYGEDLQILTAVEDNIRKELPKSDIVVGSVLVSGARTPILVKRAYIKTMKKGSVIIDVSIDQGGCFESSIPTTHKEPIYITDGVIHYAVTNMPGAYPRTATIALSKATLPFLKIIADNGIETAIKKNPEIASALNIHNGEVIHPILKQYY